MHVLCRPDQGAPPRRSRDAPDQQSKGREGHQLDVEASRGTADSQCYAPVMSTTQRRDGVAPLLAHARLVVLVAAFSAACGGGSGASSGGPYVEATHGAGRELVMRGIPGEVVMLNLLGFREAADYSAAPHLAPPEPITGEQPYRRYMEHTEPFLEASERDLLFSGRGGPFLIGPPEERWEAALLVRQRSVVDFIAFAQSPEYLAGMGHRQAALEDSRLLPLSDWRWVRDAPPRPEPCGS